jgi:hypothetical protein
VHVTIKQRDRAAAWLALEAEVILTPPVYFISDSLYRIYSCRGWHQNDFNVHA